MQKKNVNDLINKSIDDFENLLDDLVFDLQDQKFDVGQREISNLSSKFEGVLTRWWKRNYWKDEIFDFAVHNPEAAADPVNVEEFVDSLPGPGQSGRTITYDGELSNGAREYVEYAEEMSHMTGDLDMCGTTETNVTEEDIQREMAKYIKKEPTEYDNLPEMEF